MDMSGGYSVRVTDPTPMSRERESCICRQHNARYCSCSYRILYLDNALRDAFDRPVRIW